jgi:hypothetical protein
MGKEPLPFHSIRSGDGSFGFIGNSAAWSCPVRLSEIFENALQSSVCVPVPPTPPLRRSFRIKDLAIVSFQIFEE